MISFLTCILTSILSRTAIIWIKMTIMMSPCCPHNIDHVFVSKKHEQISLIFKSISSVIIPLDLSLDQKGSVLFSDNSEPVIPPPLISSVSLRAPPLA